MCWWWPGAVCKWSWPAIGSHTPTSHEHTVGIDVKPYRQPDTKQEEHNPALTHSRIIMRVKNSFIRIASCCVWWKDAQKKRGWGERGGGVEERRVWLSQTPHHGGCLDADETHKWGDTTAHTISSSLNLSICTTLVIKPCCDCARLSSLFNQPIKTCACILILRLSL